MGPLASFDESLFRLFRPLLRGVSRKSESMACFRSNRTCHRGQDRSLIPQSLDGIEVGCAVCGIETKTDADCGADEKTGDGPAVGENQIDFEPRGEEIADDDSKNDSE